MASKEWECSLNADLAINFHFPIWFGLQCYCSVCVPVLKVVWLVLNITEPWTFCLWAVALYQQFRLFLPTPVARYHTDTQMNVMLPRTVNRWTIQPTGHEWLCRLRGLNGTTRIWRYYAFWNLFMNWFCGCLMSHEVNPLQQAVAV